MMKRKLFFWLDRLQISRNERISVSALMAIMIVLITVYTFVDFSPPVDEHVYAELEKVFRERSDIRQQEHDAIMARYIPEKAIPEKGVSGSEQNRALSETGNPEKFSDSEEVAYASADSIRININKASSEELQQLPGIGPAYSRRIVEWRKEHGEFTSLEQLLEIRGIGPVRLEKIRPLIVL